MYHHASSSGSRWVTLCHPPWPILNRPEQSWITLSHRGVALGATLGRLASKGHETTLSRHGVALGGPVSHEVTMYRSEPSCATQGRLAPSLGHLDSHWAAPTPWMLPSAHGAAKQKNWGHWLGNSNSQLF